MNGPVRLADTECRTLEGELVRHARAERPSANDLARLTAALGLGSSAATATTSTTAATAAAGIVLSESATAVSTVSRSMMALLSAVAMRWLLVGGTFGVLAIGTAASIRFAWRTPATVIAQPVGGSPNRGQAAGATQLRDAGQPLPDPIDTGSAEPVAAAVDKSAPRPMLASLTPEIELLDRARTLLEAHQPSAALSVLDSYDARFPTGTLVPEATVIRIRALLRSGRRPRAVELGTRFLAADPASPHAHQVRQLLSKAPPSPP